MKSYFNQKLNTTEVSEELTAHISINDSIEKTRQALEVAYSGFDNVTDFDLIDSYIYEINSLHMRYKYLLSLVPAEAEPVKTEKRLRRKGAGRWIWNNHGNDTPQLQP